MLRLDVLRTCKVCGKQALTSEDLEFFKKSKLSLHQRESICKICASQETIKYLDSDIRRREHSREYAKNRRHELSYNPKMVEYINNYRKRYPQKASAHRIAQKRLPIGTSCTQCGATTKLERHHPNYSKPLEIITLCRNCHIELHGRN